MFRVSYYYSYLAIAFRGQPLEIWDLKAVRLLRRMSRACPVIVDMAWSGKHHAVKAVKKNAPADDASREMLSDTLELKNRQVIYRENLVVLDKENQLYHVVVKGMHVRDGREVSTQWATTSQISAMVWKGDYLAFGDNDGRISVWDLGSKHSRASSLQRGAVCRLQFSSRPADYRLAVLHSDGLALWDAAKLVMLRQILIPRDLPCSILDLDLSPFDSSLVLLTSDQAIRIIPSDSLPAAAGANCSPIADNVVSKVFCVSLLSQKCATLLELLLSDQLIAEKELDGMDFESPVHAAPKIMDKLPNGRTKAVLLAQTRRLQEEESLRRLVDLHGTISPSDWCALVGCLIGNQWKQRFWTVVSIAYAEKNAAPPEKEVSEFAFVPPYNLETFWSNSTYKQLQLLNSEQFNGRRAGSEQLSRHVANLIAFNRLDTAVQLLLDRESLGDNGECDVAEEMVASLLACLLSANHSSATCQSTIKLVATNLIANGKISEGVQLLSLIGKVVDACRYLQANGDWYRAVQLAKIALDDDEQCREVVAKWAEYLTASRSPYKSYALLLYVNLRDWTRVLELLLADRQVSVAAILLNQLKKLDHVVYQRLLDCNSKLVEWIYGEYANQLTNLGFSKAALYYCQFAGDRKETLEKQVKLLASDLKYVCMC